MSNTPNLIDLKSRSVELSYTPAGFDGQPQMTISISGQSYTRRGDKVRYTPTEIGVLITIDLEYVPDLHTDSLTLVLPQINLPDDTNELAFSTIAIRTEQRTSFGGPRLVRGPVQSYRVYHLRGTAKVVDF